MAAGSGLGDMLTAALWLIAGVVLLGLAVVVIRRLVRRAEPPAPEPFTLDQLRALHELGQLSDEEYERARGKLVARMRGRLDQPPSPAADP